MVFSFSGDSTGAGEYVLFPSSQHLLQIMPYMQLDSAEGVDLFLLYF